jgi:hypothetical protein
VKGLSMGDLVRIRSRLRARSTVYFARVSWADPVASDGSQLFGYEAVEPPKGSWGLPRHDCGTWGCATAGGNKPFSPIVDVVGTAPAPRLPAFDSASLYRNPGYDLMHDPIRRTP